MAFEYQRPKEDSKPIRNNMHLSGLVAQHDRGLVGGSEIMGLIFIRFSGF